MAQVVTAIYENGVLRPVERWHCPSTSECRSLLRR